MEILFILDSTFFSNSTTKVGIIWERNKKINANLNDDFFFHKDVKDIKDSIRYARRQPIFIIFSIFVVKSQTLISVSLCEAMTEAVNEFVVLQAPARNGKEG